MTVFGPFGYSTISATPANPTTATAVSVRKTSSWKDDAGNAWATSFYAVISHSDSAPDYGTAEIVLVTTFNSTGITLMTRAQKGTTAIAIRKGDRVWPYPQLSLDSHAIIVDGSPYALTRAGINSAITAAYTAGGGDVIIPGGLGGITLDRSGLSLDGDSSGGGLGFYQLIVPKDNVHVYVGPGTWLQPPADSSDCKVIGYVGAVGSGKQLTANSSRGTSTVTIAAGDAAAASIVEGSLVQVFDGAGPAITRTQFNIVSSVAAGGSDVITLEDPNSHDFITATPDYIRKVTTFLSNFSFEGEIRVGSNTGNTRGISVYYGKKLRFTRAITSDFDNHANAAAIWLGGCYDVDIEDCKDTGSGSTGAAAFYLDNVWRARLNNSGGNPTGFGWLIIRSGHLASHHIYAIGGIGRAIKFDNCHDAQVVAPEGSRYKITGGSGGTGVGFQWCSHMTVTNPKGMGNEAYGIFFPGVVGEYSTDMVIENPQALGNGTDLYLADQMATNRIVGGKYETTYPALTDTNSTQFGGYTLAKHMVAIAATNTTNETTVITKTIPGKLINQGVTAPMVRVTGHFNYKSTTGNRTLTFKVKYGGTTMAGDVSAAITADAAYRAGMFQFDVWNEGTNTVVAGFIRLSAPSAMSVAGTGDLATADALNQTFNGSVANASVSPASDQTLVVTFQHSTNDVELNMLRSVLQVI